MPTDLLPPASTPLERALAGASARISEVPVPLAALWDPATCPAAILPWLAWSLSVDSWEADWSIATKRAAIADSIAIHRTKGTPASVEAVLLRHDPLLKIQEWHERTPPAAPHTFEVTLPIVRPDGSTGGPRSTAAFADRVIADINRVKPLREHFAFVQRIAAEGMLGIQGVGRVAGFVREGRAIVLEDQSQPWALLLQTEDGEPLQADAGYFLEHVNTWTLLLQAETGELLETDHGDHLEIA